MISNLLLLCVMHERVVSTRTSLRIMKSIYISLWLAWKLCLKWRRAKECRNTHENGNREMRKWNKYLNSLITQQFIIINLFLCLLVSTACYMCSRAISFSSQPFCLFLRRVGFFWLHKKKEKCTHSLTRAVEICVNKFIRYIFSSFLELEVFGAEKSGKRRLMMMMMVEIQTFHSSRHLKMIN